MSLTNDHLEWFIKHPHGATLLPLFRNCMDPVKEIIESSAVARFTIQQAEAHQVLRSDCRFGVVVAGDGSTPRTAALLAASTGWQVRSWDPLLSATRRYWKDVPKYGHRLGIIGEKADRSCLLDNEAADRWLVVHCHSHAPVDSFMNPRNTLVGVVSMPCCVDHLSYMKRELGVCPYDIEDVDGVPAPSNRLFAWRLATKWS